MATFLKEPNPPTVEATDELQSRVAAMLRDIEEGGIDAVRRYSRDLDGWDPESFVVSDEEFERVSDALDPALKEHIAFAQTQVRDVRPGAARHADRPARRHGPGGRARPSPHPRRRGGRLRPRRPLPDARVVVHDGLRRRRSPASSTSSPARRPSATPGSIPRCSTRCARRARTRSSASAASRRSARWPSASSRACRRSTCSSARATPTSPRPSASCSAAWGSTSWRARPRCSSSPTRPPTRTSSPPTCSARPSTARRRPRASSRSARTSGARSWPRSTRCWRRGRPPTSPARPGATAAGSPSRPTTTRRSRSPTRRRNEHLEVQVAKEKLPMYLDAAAQLRLAVPRQRGDGGLRRQGGRDEPRPADAPRRPLHGRPLGREVPQDLHVPGADAGGHARGSRRRSRRSARRRTSPATA